ncbi:MAG: hypothetical protein ACTHU0_26775 [Kofleriaceae bacterium]
MHRKLGFGVTLTLALAAAEVAHAQRAPDTATMDRGDGITRLALDLGLSFLDSPPYDAALRIEPYGQYVTRSGLGFYGSLPIARSFGGDAPEPEATTALGNLELGGLYVVSTPKRSWVFRAGVALPTASSSADGVLTNALATYPRLTDLALAVPDAVYVRLGVSPLFHLKSLFLQLDLGFDIGIGTDEAFDPPHLLRLNAGGGVDLGLVALGLELVNLASFDGVDDNEQWVHALSFTVRFMGKALQPVIAVGSPLDESARERVKLYVAGGIQYVFR